MSKSVYYCRFTGDYARDTSHLTLIQHGAYTVLLDFYYSSGKPLPPDMNALCRICRAFDDAERDAVSQIVSQFFELRADGYHNKRADAEIAYRAEQRDRLSKGAKKTNEKRWGKDSSLGESLGDTLSGRIPSPSPSPQPKEEKRKEGAPAAPSLSFSGQHFSVTEKQDAMLGEAFPWVERQAQYRMADSWLEANPERRPKKANRFLHNWFSRITRPKEEGNGKKLTGDALTEANLRAAGFRVQ